MKTEKYFEKRSFTKDEFLTAVKECTSIRQLLIRFDLKPAGGNYRCMWTLIKRLELDTSHFHGQGWNKGKKHG